MFTKLKVVYFKEQWSFRKINTVILTNSDKRPSPQINDYGKFRLGLKGGSLAGALKRGSV